MRSRNSILTLAAVVLVASIQFNATSAQGEQTSRADSLSRGFVHPPNSARPWVYWFPLDGNITTSGITADLEAMKRVGIGGALYMEVDQGAPKGNADFGGPAWRQLFKHACSEAARLGLEINMNNDAGWCGSGGPWITPELAMQTVVFAETNVDGPRRFDAVLSQPQTKLDYYRDIAVLAFPTPPGKARIQHINQKAAFKPSGHTLPLSAQFASATVDSAIAREHIIDLTSHMKADGTLGWDVPSGSWTILRFGYTPTGKDNHPAPQPGRGLECDKLSKAGSEAAFAGLMERLVKDVGPLTGKTLVSTHIDSWEVGSQNWTGRFREDFKRLRGYDLLPFLPVMTGRIVDSSEVSERFLWDLRQTISDLLLENYAGHFRELAHKNGIRLSIEAYNTCPCDELSYAGRADEPMGEFWSWAKFGEAFSCTEMASAAHVYGKRIVGAEAFTAGSNERWLGHPGNIKDLGDWAFCEGINRFVFHRYALQPWKDVKPGMSMGPWGLHYERTQTWWEQSRAWHEYLSRCQFLLQQGLHVADICYLAPEGSPQSLNGQQLERLGHDFDVCPPEVVMSRMSVKDGRIMLPDGMSYRALVLPRCPTMTPQLLGKLQQLATAGATLIGNPVLQSPSLSRYPDCDVQVKAIAGELWGSGPVPDKLTERRIGKGRLFWGKELDPQTTEETIEDAPLDAASWIWSKEKTHLPTAPPGKRYFRRIVDIDAATSITSARLVMTADNSFECWVNGQPAGASKDWHQSRVMNLDTMLQPGRNVIAVAAENGSNTPNAAGLIGVLNVAFTDGQTTKIATDRSWEAAHKAGNGWTTDTSHRAGWAPAVEIGPSDMEPWGEINSELPVPRLFVDAGKIGDLLTKIGVPPDFSSHESLPAGNLRFIHRSLAGAEVYFVANMNSQPNESLCSFRVSGKVPELWWPDTGRVEKAAVYKEADGCTVMPLRLEDYGSVFVVFRSGTPANPGVQDVLRNGVSLLPAPAAKKSLVIEKATYGIPDDAAHSRDVRADVQKLVDAGKFSFPVSKLAERDDPAFRTVKTLTVNYSVDGKTVTASATDNNQFSFAPSETPGTSVTIRRQEDGGFRVESSEPGRYELKAADGKTYRADVDAVPAPIQITGPWELSFPAGGGAPARVTLDKLVSWSKHGDPGVKYFSGTATYNKQFTLPQDYVASGRRLTLDLGNVEVIAEVKLNGKDLGILWKRPFTVDISDAARAGENSLEVRVVNLWINRMIGDEQLPEDSDRNPNGTLKEWPKWLETGEKSPTGRFTFTSWRLYDKGSKLVDSGLLGPVSIRASQEVMAKP